MSGFQQNNALLHKSEILSYFLLYFNMLRVILCITNVDKEKSYQVMGR